MDCIVIVAVISLLDWMNQYICTSYSKVSLLIPIIISIFYHNMILGMRISDLVQIYTEYKAYCNDTNVSINNGIGGGIHPLNSMGGSSELRDNSALSTPTVTR